MVYRRLAFLIYLLWATVFQLNAQNQFVMNSGSVARDSYARKILSNIALGNNQDLRSVNLSIDYKLKKKLLPSGNKSSNIFISLELQGIEGNTKYRGFEFDSILSPAFAMAKVEVLSGLNNVFSKEMKIPLGGKQFVLDFGDRWTNTGNTLLEVEITGFEYSARDYEKFNKKVQIVNDYYGYSLLLDQFNEKFRKDKVKTRQEVDRILLQWHKTARLSALLQEEKIEELLKLKQNDTKGFLKKTKELERNYRRANTLINKSLSEELKTGFTAQKQSYCKGLVTLSEDYYQSSKNLQPYLKEAFLKAVPLNSKAGELEKIAIIAEHYDAFAYDGLETVPQLLYRLFIESADRYLAVQKNTMALKQLRNAAGIQEFFRLEKTTNYTNSLAATLNGMIESYLRVSTAAFESGNFSMAENYYLNAEKVFSENKELFTETGISSTPFSIYLNTQKDVAAQLISERKFEEAESLLENCQKITTEKNLPPQTQILGMLVEARQGIYKNLISKAKTAINNNNADGSAKLLFRAKQYQMQHTELEESKGFEDVAYSVFLDYLQRGEILLDKEKPKEAAEYLFKAKEIQVSLLGFEVERLEELLKKLSVPLIMEKVEIASFYTWAKKSDQAAELREEIAELQEDYHQEQNPEINSAVAELDFKISNRHCLDIDFQLKENTKLIANQINNADFSLAKKTLDESHQLVKQNSDCKLRTDKMDSLVDDYIQVFEFEEDFALMKTKLFSQGYTDAIDLYLKLRNTYFEKNLEQFGIVMPSLYDFVKQQNMSGLSRSSVKYFMGKEQYQLAFEYLQLMKEQGVEAETSKDLQIELGRAFAKSLENSELTSKEIAVDLTEGDKWYRFFSREMGKVITWPDLIKRK